MVLHNHLKKTLNEFGTKYGITKVRNYVRQIT